MGGHIKPFTGGKKHTLPSLEIFKSLLETRFTCKSFLKENTSFPGCGEVGIGKEEGNGNEKDSRENKKRFQTIWE